jgi:sugar transferase (PEP-CTERM/EpsH1 system associated)
MGNLLYLVHRLPYPPNKGDKVRSYHLLKHLSASHRVFLGTFIDDSADEAYVDTVRSLCPDHYIARITPSHAKVRSLAGLLSGEALGLRYYRHAGLRQWVQSIVREHRIDATVVFSSVMAQYADKVKGPAPMLVDFVDVDSAKWTQYADNHRWPMSWLYRREGEKLLAYERAVAAKARRSFFVTENETQLFLRMAPEAAGSVDAVSNGVDAAFFSPDPAFANPFPTVEAIPLVFTGAMDYWPNVDAVCWLVQDMLPALRKRWPALTFYIVGRSPTPAVQALAGDGVVVTGTVADVRPYLQHAAAVVAPLRLARGIQNKVLEAMAMARPVVAARSCVHAIDATEGTELIAADTAEDYVREVDALLCKPGRALAIGQAGRARVLEAYSWEAHLRKIDRFLPAQN